MNLRDHVVMRLDIPTPGLVVLVGPAGSGKSTFATRHFRPTKVVSSDFYRAAVADDPGDQRASAAAFRVLYLVLDERLRRGRLAVADATSLTPWSRAQLLDIARRRRLPAAAIVLALPLAVCLGRDRARSPDSVGERVVRRQYRLLPAALAAVNDEGFAAVWVLDSEAAVAATTVSARRRPCA